MQESSTRISSGLGRWPVLEGWQLDPDRGRAITHPLLLACRLLVDEAVLEARLWADTALHQGCTEVERFMRHDTARSHWVKDRVRRAAMYEMGVVPRMGPPDPVDTAVTHCMHHLWPG